MNKAFWLLILLIGTWSCKKTDLSPLPEGHWTGSYESPQDFGNLDMVITADGYVSGTLQSSFSNNSFGISGQRTTNQLTFTCGPTGAIYTFKGQLDGTLYKGNWTNTSPMLTATGTWTISKR